MIVPSSRTRSVRTAPNAAAFCDASFWDAGDLASPDLLETAMYHIKKSLVGHAPAGERRRRPVVSRSPAAADCHHSRRPAVNVGLSEKDMFERRGAIG